MADDDSRISRFLGALGKPFKRKQSPTPTMPLWTSGIQEPVMAQGSEEDTTLKSVFIKNVTTVEKNINTKLRFVKFVKVQCVTPTMMKSPM